MSLVLPTTPKRVSCSLPDWVSDLFGSEFGAILGSMATIPLTEAKAKLNELVEDAINTQERVIITKHGRPAAVLMSVDDLESMEETIYWQSQPGVHEDIAAAREEAAAGQLYDDEAVRRRYGLRISK
jgi:antitoxin YefM